MDDEKLFFLGSPVFVHLGAIAILCSRYRIHEGVQEMYQMA